MAFQVEFGAEFFLVDTSRSHSITLRDDCMKEAGPCINRPTSQSRTPLCFLVMDVAVQLDLGPSASW